MMNILSEVSSLAFSFYSCSAIYWDGKNSNNIPSEYPYIYFYFYRVNQDSLRKDLRDGTHVSTIF